MQEGFFVCMDEKIVRTYRVLIFQFFRWRRNMEAHLAIEVLRQDPLIIALAFSMLVFQKYLANDLPFSRSFSPGNSVCEAR
jgi:hypothetical protein